MAKFAEILVFCWMTLTITLFVCGWLNYQLLITAVCHRVAQWRDRNFALRPSTPTHATLFGLCALIYGLILPVWYFASIRMRHGFEIWEVGPHANNPLTILIGAGCTVWLLGKVFAAARGGRALRFGGRTDRLFAAAGLLVFAWIEFWLVVNLGASYSQFRSMAQRDPAFIIWLIGVLFPLPFFLGTIYIYAAALIDALKTPAEIVSRGRRILRRASMAAALAIIFAPYLLSLPRVSHRQALRLIEEQRGQIIDVAERADLDPRLLAGIIYVNQTRDRPRLTGELIEQFGMQCNRSHFITSTSPYDCGLGLCGLRPTALGAINFSMMMAPPTRSSPPIPAPQRPLSMDEWLQRRPIVRDLKLNITSIRDSSNYYFRSIPNDKLRVPLHNITLAATEIHLLRSQWRDAGRPIDSRPEILATLYNLGFDLSKPKPDPRPNDFGRRVKAFMESADCARLFPPAGNSSKAAKP